jgi:Ca-activated chloride channel family protein
MPRRSTGRPGGRAGDYAAALDTWEQLESEASAYNHANALAKLGRLDDALAAYDKLLQQNPAHEDARYNKQAIEEFLKNQQSQQQQGQQGEQQQQQQGDQQQQQSGQGETQPEESEQAAGSSQDQSETGEQDQQQAQQDQQQSQQGQQQSQQGDTQQQQSQAREQASKVDQQTAESETMAELDQQMSEQAAEQWLRKIPDDPGGLLRRKFIYQYRKRGGVDAEGKPW